MPQKSPRALWAEGMKCATYVINKIPLSPNNMKSSYELMFGEKPNIKNLRVFGFICYVHIPDSQRSKLDPKARKCIFVGYDERKKGWKCMDLKTHRFVVSRDVGFDVSHLSYGVASKGEGSKILHPGVSNLPITSASLDNTVVEELSERGSPETQQCETQQEDDALVSQRPNRTIIKPAHFRDENFVSTNSCFFAGPIDDKEPSYFEKAKGVKEWKLAMDDEMEALMKNQTWSLVPKPRDVQPVSCKWVYKIKRRADVNIDK